MSKFPTEPQTKYNMSSQLLSPAERSKVENLEFCTDDHFYGHFPEESARISNMKKEQEKLFAQAEENVLAILKSN